MSTRRAGRSGMRGIERRHGTAAGRRAMVAALLLTAAPALASGVCGAQEARAALSLGGGVATDARGVRSSAMTAAPSLVLTLDPRFSVGLGGSATSFAQQEGWALGGTASAGLRLPLGAHLALAATGLASRTATSFDATYATTALVPTLEARLGVVTLFGGAQLVRGTSTFEDSSHAPGGPLGPLVPGGGARAVGREESRSSVGAVYGAAATIAGPRPGSGGTALYREERLEVADVPVTDRTLTLTATTHRLQLSASGGLRQAPDERARFFSAGATLALTRLMALEAAGGSYPSNRLTGVPGGRFMSVGLLLHGVPWRDGAREAPPLRGAPPVPADAMRLVLRAPEARRVELAGDWSAWRTVPATRAADGLWYVDVRVSRGEYRYAFRVDGERWVVPENVPTVDDGFGGRSAVLVVP